MCGGYAATDKAARKANQCFQKLLVCWRKPVFPGAVQIQHAEKLTVRDQRDNEFRRGSGITRDMAGKGMNIRDALCGTRPGGRAAHPFPHSNARAGDAPLKRAEHEFPLALPLRCGIW